MNTEAVVIRIIDGLISNTVAFGTVEEAIEHAKRMVLTDPELNENDNINVQIPAYGGQGESSNAWFWEPSECVECGQTLEDDEYAEKLCIHCQTDEVYTKYEINKQKELIFVVKIELDKGVTNDEVFNIHNRLLERILNRAYHRALVSSNSHSKETKITVETADGCSKLETIID